MSDLSTLGSCADRFDLIAVRSSSEKVVLNAMQQHDVDMVSIDMAQRTVFRIKRPLLNVAIEKGVFFELRYSALLSGVSSERRYFLANAADVLETTKGKHVVVTSGAPHSLAMRGAYDVMNLCSLFGMDVHIARIAVSVNAAKCLAHGLERKSSFKGAIKLELQSHDPRVAPEDTPIFMEDEED